MGPLWLPRFNFLGSPLSLVIVYVWSRKHPEVVMSFLGMFQFQAPYLAWVLLGFGYMLGQSIADDLLGIAVGHLLYFLDDVYPQMPGGRRLLRAPEFLINMFDREPEQWPQDAPAIGAGAAGAGGANAANARREAAQQRAEAHEQN